MRDDRIAALASVLYLLFLPLYPLTTSMMEGTTSEFVIAIATVVNVLVAIVYLVITWGLWRETQRTAQTAAAQVDLSRQEMRLRLRPYVNVNVEMEVQKNGRVRYRGKLHNVGPVLAPAKFRVFGTLDGQSITVDEGQNIIFPGETMHGHWQELGNSETWGALERGQLRFHIAVHVDYSGPWPGETYGTAVGWAHTPPHTMTIDEVDVT